MTTKPREIACSTDPPLTCEEAIAPAYGTLVRRALFAGWTADEIRAAVVALAIRPLEATDGGRGENSLRGRGHRRVAAPEVTDTSGWTAEDHETARLFEDIFPPDAIQRMLAKRHQKETITIRLDQDLVEGFRADGDDWHSRINDALRTTRKGPNDGG